MIITLLDTTVDDYLYAADSVDYCTFFGVIIIVYITCITFLKLSFLLANCDYIMLNNIPYSRKYWQ